MERTARKHNSQSENTYDFSSRNRTIIDTKENYIYTLTTRANHAIYDVLDKQKK